MAKLSPQGPFRALDNNGDPLNGGKLYTYIAGTSTPKDTFTDESGTVPNANPVILDANGYANVWLGDGAYKFVLDDSADVNQWTLDDISGDVSESFGNTVVDVAVNTLINETNRNNVIRCTAAVTLSLLDVSSATDGFIFTVRNDSSGDVTVDPDGSETIDGSATLTIPAGTSCAIVCNGSTWYSLFLAVITIASQSEAEAGTNNENLMTPLRTFQSIDSFHKPAFRATMSAQQLFSLSTITKVEFDTETFDEGGDYDADTNYRFTPTVAGKYVVNTSCVMSVGNNTDARIYIYKNGTAEVQQNKTQPSTSGTYREKMEINDIIEMNGTTDYIEVFVYMAGSGNPAVQDVENGATASWFESYRLMS